MAVCANWRQALNNPNVVHERNWGSGAGNCVGSNAPVIEQATSGMISPSSRLRIDPTRVVLSIHKRTLLVKLTSLRKSGWKMPWDAGRLSLTTAATTLPRGVFTYTGNSDAANNTFASLAVKSIAVDKASRNDTIVNRLRLIARSHPHTDLPSAVSNSPYTAVDL